MGASRKSYSATLSQGIKKPLAQRRGVKPTRSCEGLLADALLECLQVFLRSDEAVFLLRHLVGDGCTVLKDCILECLGRLVGCLLLCPRSLHLLEGFLATCVGLGTLRPRIHLSLRSVDNRAVMLGEGYLLCLLRRRRLGRLALALQCILKHADTLTRACVECRLHLHELLHHVFHLAHVCLCVLHCVSGHNKPTFLRIMRHVRTPCTE